MKKTSKTVVFFGSGPVAAQSLELLAEDFAIEAVVTKPRALHHKGEVPVLETAGKLGLPVLEVSNKAELNDLVGTQPFRSSLGVLVDFGIIVSQKVIDYFPKGIVNSHFSLLPQWRGADPITFSILSGQQETGVSLMLLTSGMDEGPLLAQSIYKLHDTTTTPELTDELIQLSHAMLTHIVPLYLKGEVQPAPQEQVTLAESNTPSYSRKLTKQDGIMNWSKPAPQIEREIRAFASWPKSRCQFGRLELIVLHARVIDAEGVPGKTAVIEKQPAVYCGDQALILDRLQPAGKAAMTGQAFLAGYKNAFLI